MKNLIKILFLSLLVSFLLSENLITDVQYYESGGVKEIRYFKEINKEMEIVKLKTYYENRKLEKEGKYENGRFSRKSTIL